MRVLLAVLVIGLLCRATAHAAAFQQVIVADPGNPPIAVNIWYPSTRPVLPKTLDLQPQNIAIGAPVEGNGLGLIVISHGTGGSGANHIDTALALADAGFVVAAPTHTGDNLHDLSRQVQIQDRPRQLHRVLDYMLGEWPGHRRIDAGRVGAFGFSAGGFTVLVAIGGRPDMTRVAAHCRDHAQDWTCQMLATHPAVTVKPVWVHDARIHAAVIAAPALGYVFGKAGLADVHVPVQLWRAANDHVLPQPFYAQAVYDDLPRKPDYHVQPGADHLDFLAPCSAALAEVAKPICMSAPGFDRVAFHAAFDREIVGFFRANLQ